ncbi:MAG: DNA-processing protein DprA [Rhodovibrionaceae bacterium]|nr:DNA-processing protein DprA [Rhodovibrionaceae bacterium]
MAGRQLSRQERIDWLRLLRSENVGPVTFHQLLRRFGEAAAALEALPGLAARGGLSRKIRICPAADAERELDAAESAGVRVLASCEPDYPALLSQLDDAPPLLSALGHLSLLQRPGVGVVGARNASANGRRLASQICRELAARQILVVSGLARGIDAAAHQGALEGGTAAVMAGGVDVVYPPEHEQLYREIAERGAVVSEMPLATEPQARHFPRRNRLISGLSHGVLVVEAAPKSGSLITARLAGDHGREVMAVPGSPLDPRARGCNDLLRQGASLVESAEDVLEVLAPILRQPLKEDRRDGYAGGADAGIPPDSELSEVRESVLELLGAVPVPVDEVIRQCQFSAPAVLTVLLELELASRLERHPGNRVSLVAEA